MKRNCIVCLKPKLSLFLVQPIVDAACAWNMSTNGEKTGSCTNLSRKYPLRSHRDIPPTFVIPDKNASFTCFSRSNCSTSPCKEIGNVTVLCNTTVPKDSQDDPTHHIRTRLWWYCGGAALYGKLTSKWIGVCAMVTVVQESTTIILENNTDMITNVTENTRRKRRSTLADLKTSLTDGGVYFDAIGMPRGIPYDAMLIDEGKAAASHLPLISAVLPIMTYKNTGFIYYLNYKIVLLYNFTELMHSQVAEQLHATSVMALQNHLALDLLLAEKGGLCKFIQDTGECCTVIPMHTAENGSITQLLSWFRTYRENMYRQEGVTPNPVLQWFQDTFGNWKNPFIALIMSLAVGCVLLLFLSCCCKLVISRLFAIMDTRINVVLEAFEARYHLVDQDSEGEEDNMV
ncbi:syncytin-A-like [Dunckerocampus dactyliophorus]|uniref:syncytin-A-like n=1 Tax=Dunckerocampus dactyliophorus TaxID=161453 RepID=UPI0024062F1C|nr:syncytin-A-like [Dunckerocampus dactyliophorus]